MKQRTKYEKRIVDLGEEMRRLEAKYSMSTEEFYAMCNAGEYVHSEATEADFMWWAAMYERKQKQSAAQ